MHSARIPPVDPAPATITAVLAMHAGHICPSSEPSIRSRRLACTGVYQVRASPQGLLNQDPPMSPMAPVIKTVLFSMFISSLWLYFLHAIAHACVGGYVLQQRLCVYPVSASRSHTSALTSLRYRFAQRHMAPSGAMIVLPSLANEYSTEMAFDCVTCLAIKPADS
jgi:hypothetical protein